MKLGIFYFSGTGNTWFAAHSIARQWDDFLGEKASVHSIEEPFATLSEKILSYDMICIGYPIYGSDIPLPMKEFLSSLPPLPPKKRLFVGVFCTQWMFSGDGTKVALEFLPHGYDILCTTHLCMPNNVCVSPLHLPYRSYITDTAIEKKIAKKVHIFVKSMKLLKRKRQGFSAVSTFLGAMQRNPFRKYEKDFRSWVGIDKDRCISCNLCYAICPAANFEKDPIHVRNPSECIYCLRCYNFCPTYAITFNEKSHNIRKGIPYRGPQGYTVPTLR